MSFELRSGRVNELTASTSFSGKVFVTRAYFGLAGKPAEFIVDSSTSKPKNPVSLPFKENDELIASGTVDAFSKKFMIEVAYLPEYDRTLVRLSWIIPIIIALIPIAFGAWFAISAFSLPQHSPKKFNGIMISIMLLGFGLLCVMIGLNLLRAKRMVQTAARKFTLSSDF